ncbi:zinc finger protein 692-like, partial [Lagopus leucura]|uniref:zinc finger protein 692-like n=1 Tax=Lagopus leucura TaxID=30410 RepID=UPI001C6804BA
YSAVSTASHPTEPNLLHANADALQRLVALSHGHSRECGFVPDVKPPTPGSPAPLVWECVAGHSFTWGGPSDAPQRGDGGGGGSQRGSPAVPVRRRSLRRSGVVMEVMVEEPDAGKDDGVWSPGGGGDGGGDGAPRPQLTTALPAAPQGQTEAEVPAADRQSSTPGLEEKAEQHAVPQEEEEDEDQAEEDDLAYNDDWRDENYQPPQDSDSEPQRRQSQPQARKKAVKEEQDEQNPMDSSSAEDKGGQISCKQPTRPCDEDVAQIGPKRIR